jgi:hypothetical protein
LRVAIRGFDTFHGTGGSLRFVSGKFITIDEEVSHARRSGRFPRFSALAATRARDWHHAGQRIF